MNKQYYTAHAEDYKRHNRQYKKRKRLKETEPEQTPEERRKSIAEWIIYMNKKY